jgi:hypothetical protein
MLQEKQRNSAAQEYVFMALKNLVAVVGYGARLALAILLFFFFFWKRVGKTNNITDGKSKNAVAFYLLSD